jgi:hypothetical protein
MAKRGRPKKPPRPSKDEGTPELQEKRKLIAPTNQTLATNPLDIMKARGRFITDAQYAAAEHFRACRLKIFGSPHPVAVNLLRTHGVAHEAERAQAEYDYREGCRRLLRQSDIHFRTIERLLFHEVMPAFVWNPGRKKARAVFDAAMDMLERWHKDCPHDRPPTMSFVRAA